MDEFLERAVSGGTLLHLDTGGDWTHLFRVDDFRIFFTLDATASAPADLSTTLRDDVPDYILRLAAAFVQARGIYVTRLGLADPLHSGRFHREGAQFIDLLIDDIPAQRGLVSGQATSMEGCFLAGREVREKAVRIRIHRALIVNSATPIHELFHVFQYAYAPFTNAWFMEGLARWGQNLIQRRKMIEEHLPQTPAELDAFLVRAHDAEYFWRRLFSFYGGGEALIRPLLEAVAAEADAVESHGGTQFRWDKRHKGRFGNNALLLRALLKTLRGAERSPSEELDRFLALCAGTRHVEPGPSDEALQRFFSVLEKASPASVTEYEGRLYCDSYDPESRRLAVEELDVGMLDRYELDALNLIESLEGTLLIRASALDELNGFNYLRHAASLRIESMPNLGAIRGFNALESVGELVIRDNEALQDIDGFNALFGTTHAMPGAVRITDNPKLASVRFLHGLERTASSLYLHHNALESLEGLESLRSVGASLSLSSNRLTSLRELSQLVSVGGMLGIAYNRLETLRGLEKLSGLKTVRWNGAPRTVVLHGNPRLRDLSALSGVETEEGYLVISVDDVAQYEVKPPPEAPLYTNMLHLFGHKARRIVPSYDFIRKTRHDYRRFRAVTHNGVLTHMVDFETPSDTLVVSFSGFNGFLGGMFHNRYPYVTSTHPSHKLFVIDRSNSWYHLGVKGLFDDIGELFEQIRYLIARGGYGRVLCCGASMGGYLSLAAAAIEGVTDVLALSPQTFLDAGNRERYGDGRWKKEVERLQKQTPTPELLDLNAYYRLKGMPKARIRLLYAQGVALDVRHALHIDAPYLERVGYDIDSHYLAAYLHKKGELRGIILSILGSDPDRPRLLFGHNWIKATGACDWMDAFHARWGTPEELFQYCYDHDIATVFGNNYTTQRWLLRHGASLTEKGIGYLVNREATMLTMVDKQRFEAEMIRAGYGAYVSRRYASPEAVRFPCIVKPRSGGAGRGIFVAETPEMLPEGEEMLLFEYLPGRSEYATSFFIKDAATLFHRSYRKDAPSEPYVFQSEPDMVTERVETPFLELFEQIIARLNGTEGYCMCSINYKIVDGIPKIFEINPRIGYTLAQHPADFRVFMQRYLEETTRQGASDA